MNTATNKATAFTQRFVKAVDMWAVKGNALKTKTKMIYDYDEGGSFWVGPNFGCVHFKKKEVKA